MMSCADNKASSIVTILLTRCHIMLSNLTVLRSCLPDGFIKHEASCNYPTDTAGYANISILHSGLQLQDFAEPLTGH